jgi:hypothetical protein
VPNVQLQEPTALIEVFCLQARNLPKVESVRAIPHLLILCSIVLRVS